MKARVFVPRVFFNASVVLSGLRSPSGGSAKLLSWVKKGIIRGIVSELILDEAMRNSQKVGVKQEEVKKIAHFFQNISVPDKTAVSHFETIIVDSGDAHVLASSIEANAEYLVTLDKKHILVLAAKLKNIKIITPGQFIEEYSRKVSRLKIEHGVG